jgi:hypothetical protein
VVSSSPDRAREAAISDDIQAQIFPNLFVGSPAKLSPS